MAVQAFLLKGKEFRLTTDNEKEKGNWLLLKNQLYEQIMTSVRKTESVMDRIGCTFRFFLGNKDRNADL